MSSFSYVKLGRVTRYYEVMNKQYHSLTVIPVVDWLNHSHSFIINGLVEVVILFRS